MSFDPITGIWAASKAAEMVGGSSGGSSGGGTPLFRLNQSLDKGDFEIILTAEQTAQLEEIMMKTELFFIDFLVVDGDIYTVIPCWKKEMDGTTYWLFVSNLVGVQYDGSNCSLNTKSVTGMCAIVDGTGVVSGVVGVSTNRLPTDT